MARKGERLSEETRRRIGKAVSKASMGHPYRGGGMLGLKHSDEARKKMSETHKRIGTGKSNKGRKLTEEHKKKLSEHFTGFNAIEICQERILAEIPALEKQGFRCIPITKVIPDIIGIDKYGNVTAFEVEYGKPNYDKYTEEIKEYYDDVVWLIRNKKYE